MRKKIASVLMIGTVIASMLVGCGSKDSDQSGKDTSEDGVVTLTYWGWDANYYEPLFEAYEKENPKVKFEATAVEWGDMLPKAQQALASGSELPSIVAMNNELMENWKALDICIDLAEYGFDNSGYVESLAKKAVTEDGAVIGAQESIDPAGMAYKRDLAKEYFGTDDPDELFEIFSTFDAYAQKGKEVYEKSGGKVHLFHSGQSVGELLSFGSAVENMNGDTLEYTAKMTDIMSTLIKLRDANAVDSYQSGTPEANATYADDAHIFYPCPSWSISYYIKPNNPDGSGNWGLMRAPVDCNMGGTALGIIKDSTDEQKQAAYDFVVWATQGDGAAVAREKAGYITPFKALMEDPKWVQASEEDKAFFGGEDIAKVFYQDIAPNMASIPSSEWDNAMTNVRNDLAQQLMDDKSMTLEQAISLGKEQIEQLVTDENVKIK